MQSKATQESLGRASIISSIPLLANSTFAIDEVRGEMHQKSKSFRLTDSPIGKPHHKFCQL